MKKVVGLVLVMLLVVGMTTLVWAHGSYGARANTKQGTPQYKGARNYQAALDLSADQEEQVEQLEGKYEDKVEDAVDEVRDKQEQLHELYFDKEVSKEEIIKVQTEVNQLRTNLMELQTEYKLDLRDVLSPEQLEECAEYGGFGFGKLGLGASYHHQGGFGHGMRGGFGGHGRGMRGSRW